MNEGTLQELDTDERQDILLESGTNEVEIMEFVLRDQSFGVNVAKVQQISQFDRTRHNTLPDTVPAMMGTYLHRGVPVPLVDLARALNMQNQAQAVDKPLVMVCEFNQVVCGFFIDGVRRIHRLSWQDIRPLNDMLARRSPVVISSVHIDDTDVLIVDLEHILATLGIADSHELAPGDVVQPAMRKGLADARVVLAEDSNFIRTRMVENMRQLGLTAIQAFTDGQRAMDAIQKHVDTARANRQPITDFFNIVITDIEMPRMDGLTLCRRIKQELKLPVPVIIYSSLINEQMGLKCKQVGADHFCCKPQIADLIKLIAGYMGQPAPA